MTLGFREITVLRAEGGEYVDGVWTPGDTEEVVIQGSVQPLSETDTDRLPPGQRTRARFKLYTTADLLTPTWDGSDPSEDPLPVQPDLVEWGGIYYVVNGDANYGNAIIGSALNHRKYILLAPESV